MQNVFMPEFGLTIRRLMAERKISMKELSTSVGCSMNTVHRLRTMKSASIHGSTYRSLASALGLTPDQLDREWRGIQKRDKSHGGPGIPVINRAPAGQIMPYDEIGPDSGTGRAYIDRGNIADPDAFSVVVIGDSMSPALAEGDYAVFVPIHSDGTLCNNPKRKISDGHTVFVRFLPDSGKDGCTIGMIHRLKDGRIEIRKLNPRYGPVIVSPEVIAVFALVEIRRIMLNGYSPEHSGYLDTPPREG